MGKAKPMKFYQFAPSPELQNIIAYFWTLQTEDESEYNALYRFIPDGYVDWIFHQKEPWQFRYTSKEKDYSGFYNHFLGHATNFIDIQLPASSFFLIGIKFYPWAAHHIWGDRMKNFTDTCLSFDDLNDRQAIELAESLRATTELEHKIAMIEKEILKRLEHYKPGQLIPIVNHLFANPKQNAIGKYANSQRRLEQCFNKEIGISPKLFQRTVRINHAIQHMLQEPRQSLTHLAYQMGYFDQSHFIRDFKKFSGLSPTRFLNLIKPDGDIFNLRIA